MADRKPSQTTDSYWIIATNRTSQNNKQPEKNCGKWLLFPKIPELDVTWEKIREATELGKLGFASKAKTMASHPGYDNDPTKVICVYTYDHEDEADVMRVREALRELGFGVNQKLPYKTDDATYSGHYRSSGHRKISKYYC